MREKLPSHYFSTVAVVSTAVISPLVALFVFGGDPVGLIRRSTSAEIVRFLVVLAGATGCAVVAHALVRRWFVACAGSAIAFTLLVQVAAYLSVGYLDPFIVIALITGMLIGFSVAAIVGLPFYLLRRRRGPDGAA